MRALKITLAIVASVLGLACVGVAAAWTPDLPLDRLKERWAPAPSQFVRVDGMQVHLRDEGRRDDPLPLLLLHGTSASLHTWDGWVAALKDEHRVIRVDLPGFGLTGPTPDGDYGMAVYTRFIVDLLDQLHVNRVAVVGNSFGGYIAWKTAVDHPERVGKLILIDAGGYAYQARSMPLGFRLAQISALAPLMTKLMTRGLIQSSVRNVYGDPSKVTPALIDRYYDLTLREGNRSAVVERFRQSRGGEFEAQIKRVQQPTLILWGANDHLIPVENAQRFAQDIRGSRVMVLDGLGHVPHEEDPARTVAAARDFLSQP